MWRARPAQGDVGLVLDVFEDGPDFPCRPVEGQAEPGHQQDAAQPDQGDALVPGRFDDGELARFEFFEFKYEIDFGTLFLFVRGMHLAKIFKAGIGE